MKISTVTRYGSEPNIFKTAHHVAITATADKDYEHGEIYPANDGTAKGVVYHDTEAGQPLTVITEGHLLAPALPTQPTELAQDALRQIEFYDLV